MNSRSAGPLIKTRTFRSLERMAKGKEQAEIKYFIHGKEELLKGNVLAVVRYHHILIEYGEKRSCIPFVGIYLAISSVKNTNGQELYNNPLIDKNYNVRNLQELNAMRERSFGNRF